MILFTDVLQDALFAALAAVGFASISNPPRQTYGYCALIAGMGHAVRFFLMHLSNGAWGLISASFAASLLIGCLAVLFSNHAKCPPETFSFPSLLPIIPGMYAYRTVEGIVMCLSTHEEQVFHHYLYLCLSNGLTCIFDILGMVLGVTIPIFVFKKISFRVTRYSD